MHTHKKCIQNVAWLVLVTLAECCMPGADSPGGVVLLPSQLRGTARDPHR